MRTPLRLALGITSALVIGALTATIATALASPNASAPIVAPLATIVDAPVLGPSTVNGVSTLPSSENPLSLPKDTGQVRVVQPDLSDAWAAIGAGEPLPAIPLPADVVAAAAALDAGAGDAPDTPAAIADAAASVTGTDSATPDDPCADPSADPTSCLSGLHSAIFADTYHEPLQMWVIPAAHTSHTGTSVWCDGAAPGAGELWLDVATNLPATIHASYWPANHPSDVHQLDIEGVPSEVAAWQAEIDSTGTYTLNSYVFQHCSMLTGLAPDTTYVVSAYATDTYDRISTPKEATFSSAGEPTNPTMFAVPLGQSLLYVGVPYAPAQGEPMIEVTSYARGAQPPSCTDSHFAADIGWAITPHSSDVSADYLSSHHYVSSYSQQYAGVLNVPEGTNMVICALWYDSQRASFDRATPSYFETLLAASPDTATPVFTLESVRTIKAVNPYSLLISGSSLVGSLCGEWNGPESALAPLQTLTVGLPLCNRGVAYGPASALGFQVTTSYLTPGAAPVEHSSVIRMRSTLCAGGGCPLPPDSTYTIDLPTVPVTSGMCGSSSGSDCTPPTTDTSLGTATISLHWEQGASNGNTDWSVGAAAEVAPTAAHPDSPQFDTNHGWSTALSTDGLTASATLQIRADRPVNYVINVSGDCWTGSPAAPIAGRASRADGTYFTAETSVAGLCPGSRYESTIALVDDAGHRTLASATYPTASIAPTAFEAWGGGSLTMPQDHLVITAHVQVLHSYPWYNNWWIAGADLTVGNPVWPNTAHFDQVCRAFDDNNADGVWPAQTVPVAASMHITVASRFAIQSSYTGHPATTVCDWSTSSNFEAHANADVTPDQLLRGVLIQTDFFETGVRNPSVSGHVYVWVTATRVPR